jgi:hypothetical protein
MEIETKNNTNTNPGSKILNENKFFRDFISLMNNKEFKFFYETYFHDWTDTQTMIFYMKLHSTIEYEYYTRYNCNISDEIMAESLYNIISNTQTRKIAMQLFNDFKVDYNASSSFRSLIKFDINSDSTLLTIENK